MRPKSRLLVAAVLVAVVIAAAVATAAEKKTDQADIRADKMVYRWDTNTWEFTGNVRVEIKGPDKALLTAPKMTGKLAQKATQITEIKAVGPVRFEVTTQKDADGIQRRIVATGTGDAVYTGTTRVIALTGGAQAEMTTLPPEPDVQPTRFQAEQLTINLKSFTVEGENVHIEAEVPASGP